MQCVGRQSDPPGDHPPGVQRDASCAPVPAGRLRAIPGPVLWSNRNGRARVRRESAGPAMDFFFLVRLQADSTIRRLKNP